MYCRFCGTTLPGDSMFCYSCGRTLATSHTGVSVGAASAPKPTASVKFQKRSTGTSLTVIVVLGIVLIAALYLWFMNPAHSSSYTGSSGSQPVTQTRQARVMPLVDTSFTLNAAQGTQLTFSVPANATEIRVEGMFTASGGSGNDIEVYLLNEDEFVNWQNGHRVNTLYNSGRMTQGTLNTVLPPGAGKYHLVFNNKFSLLSPKAVKASIRLRYIL
jgi:hypothetical protein